MNSEPDRIAQLEARVDELEHQCQTLALTLKTAIDRIRAIQIEDEHELRILYDELRTIKRE